MKYGMRERVSGIVIIVALAIVVLPMLFDTPDDMASPEGSTMTIDQPVSVSQQEVDAPRSPLDTQESDSLQQEVSQSDQLFPGARNETASDTEPELSQQTASPGGATPAASDRERVDAAAAEIASNASETGTGAASESAAEDPIMAAASGRGGSNGAGNSSGAGNSGSGEGFAVQAGSFGQPDNADRLIAQLKEQGFSAYQRPRGNLHTVYVGPFDSTEASEQARTRLQSRANIKGLIVRREGGQ